MFSKLEKYGYKNTQYIFCFYLPTFFMMDQPPTIQLTNAINEQQTIRQRRTDKGLASAMPKKSLNDEELVSLKIKYCIYKDYSTFRM